MMNDDNKEDDFFWDQLLGVFTDEWRDHAACSGLAPIFFDENREDEAKQICSGCPVRVECLDDSLHYGDVETIRGGLNWKGQQTLARHRSRYAPYLRADLAAADGQ